MMNVRKIKPLFVIGIFTFFIFLEGCSKNNNTDPIQDPVPTANDTVKITGFSPATGVTGTQVTITGQHFSPILSNNIVKFNQEVAKIINATPTSLQVEVPLRSTTGEITVTVNGKTFTSTSVFNKVAIVDTLAGAIGQAGFVNGTGAAARFKYPLGMAVDVSGNVYVADVDNHSIRKITTAGAVTTFAGNGSIGYVDANGTSAQFTSPYDIVFDSHGNLFVTEYYGNRIRKISPQGDVTTFAGNGTAGYVNGAGTTAQFHSPWGITIDANDNLYVCDYSNNRIRKITPSGMVSTFAGNGMPANNFGDMPTPKDITIDPSGNFYVIGNPFSTRPITRITATGVISNFAPSPLGSGLVDGDLSEALFTAPSAICSDGEGNIYVTGYGNITTRFNIRKISASQRVSTINTWDSFLSDGLVVDQSGNLFVSSINERIILKIR